MKYTSFAVVVLGALIACYAGAQFLIAGPLGQSDTTPAWRLSLGLAFGAALVFAGAMMWLFGGKGYTSGGARCQPWFGLGSEDRVAATNALPVVGTVAIIRRR